MSMPTEAELTGIEHDRLRVEIALTDLNELPLDDLLSFLIHPARAVDEVTRLRAEVQRLTAKRDNARAAHSNLSATMEERISAAVQRLTAERDAERLRCAKIAATNHCDSPTCCNAACDTGRAIEAKIRSGE